MSENQLIFRTVDYRIAEGRAEIMLLIEEGWEPHGSATFSPNLGVVRQPMVKRELVSVEDYIKGK